VIVFLHGVPETAEFWDVRERIDRPSVALELPGFGVERPPGFGSTPDDYVAWVLDQIDAIGEPVDLVGHDIGAPITYRAVTLEPRLVRSWVGDVAQVVHPDYEWHVFAKTWQTPGQGEEFFEAQKRRPVEETAAGYQTLGVPADAAETMAKAVDEEMADSILRYYRAATPNLHHRWGADLGPAEPPGLVVTPEFDPFDDLERAKEMAALLGAEHRFLPGLGHFWPVEAPDRAAALLTEFWDSIAS